MKRLLEHRYLFGKKSLSLSPNKKVSDGKIWGKILPKKG